MATEYIGFDGIGGALCILKGCWVFGIFGFYYCEDNLGFYAEEGLSPEYLRFFNFYKLFFLYSYKIAWFCFIFYFDIDLSRVF